MSLPAFFLPHGWALGAPALLALGAAASPHCALMCGALSMRQAGATHRLCTREALLWTQGGRVAGYASAGALAGALGQSLLHELPAPWVGEAARAIAAAATIAIGLWTIWRLCRPAPPCCRRPTMFFRSRWPTRLRLFLQGGAWALLPCGLLYSVLLLATFSATAMSGALLAAAFALGGSPLLMAVGWSGSHAGTRLIGGRLAGAWLIGFGAVGLLAVLWNGPAALPGWCALHF
jgi:sulfite exporter TauE/SafE